MNGPAGLAVECCAVVVEYDSTPVLRSVDLLVKPGETVALLGPSGSGKTTLLYAIAGFLPLAAGTIHLAGALVATPEHGEPPEKRSLGMVFQHYGLWPHMAALDTVAYPLRRSGMGAERAREQAAQLLEQLGIGHLAGRQPGRLSGGEQQRVGLARALARRPAVYLLDEPTAHLDTVLKSGLQAELTQRMHADGAAAIHATHDVEEALAVADRVVLLRDGAVVQVAAPEVLYAQPADEWAARLTGPASFVDGIVGAEGGLGEPGRYLVRPDWVHFDGPIEATVREVRYRGTHTDYGLATSRGSVLLRDAGTPRLATGSATSFVITRAWRMPVDR